MLPWSPATTAVLSVTVSVTSGAEACQFCAKIHHVPASASPTSQNSSAVTVALAQTCVAALGSLP